LSADASLKCLRQTQIPISPRLINPRNIQRYLCKSLLLDKGAIYMLFNMNARSEMVSVNQDRYYA